MNTTTPTQRRHKTRRLHDAAIRAGIHPNAVRTTAPDDLAAVLRMAPQLRLIPDHGFESEGVNTAVDELDEAPDERASTLYFLQTMRATRAERAAIPAPSMSYLGGDDFGGSAA